MDYEDELTFESQTVYLGLLDLPRGLVRLRLRGCSGFDALPEDLADQAPWLEELSLVDCHVETVPADFRFPPALRVLRLRGCRLRAFEPPALPSTLMQFDLSSNNLERLPACLLNGARLPPSVDLQKNDFWYSMYSGLSLSRVTMDAVPELLAANALGLVSTAKLSEAVKRLGSLSTAAMALSQGMGFAIERRANAPQEEALPKQTYNQPQNVHLSSVQDTAKASLKALVTQAMRVDVDPGYASKLAEICGGGGDLVSAIEENSRNVVCTRFGMTISALQERVYQLIKARLPERGLADAVRQELLDGRGLCFTGRFTRLINACNGFVDGVCVTVSRKEQLTDEILTIRARTRREHAGNVQAYLAEAIPRVMQALEEACVPEPEQVAWLEYV